MRSYIGWYYQLGSKTMLTIKYLRRSVFLFFLILSCPLNLQAEFYRYVDDNGRIFFVDDLSRVPPEYRDQVYVYKEKYDHLPPEQRKSRIEHEQQQQEAIELEQQRRLEFELQQAAEQEAAQRKRQEQLVRQKKMQTPIVVDGNRVFVPVTIGNNGLEVEVRLLLDTGASQTVVFRDTADQLNIIALKKGLSQVAGGQQIYSEVGKVDYLKIGPHKLDGATVLVINHDGPPVTFNGLLGMNFLKNFKYDIDFENQLIHWQPAE